MKPVDVTTPSTPTVSRHSQSSPATLVDEPARIVIPDSVERPNPSRHETQVVDSSAQAVDSMDIDSPPPVTKKVKPRPRPAANTQIDDLFDDFFTKAVPKTSAQIKRSPRKPKLNDPANDPFAELTSPRKPPKPEVEEPEVEDYAPAATEMRKRLAAQGTQYIVPSDESDTPTTIPSKSKAKGKKRAASDDDEIVAAAKERKK